jgi:hypothetical protein
MSNNKESTAEKLVKATTIGAVLRLIASGEVTEEQGEKRIAELTAKVTPTREIYFKVSEKGAVSVYGLQKQFPVTLYLGQWERLLTRIDGDDGLKAFIEKNRDKLSVKPAKT